MMNDYKYVISDRYKNYLANYNNDHIAYNGEQYWSIPDFVCAYEGCLVNYDNINFLIECTKSNGNIIYTTSFKKIHHNITGCSVETNRRLIKIYELLEKKRKGKYVEEIQDPMLDDMYGSSKDLNEYPNDNLEPNDILKSINFAMEMVSKYTKQLDSPPETQKYTAIYEQLDVIKKYIKN